MNEYKENKENKMSATIIQGILRHILTIVAGYLTAKFALDANMLDAAISAVVALVGVVWSIFAKTPYEAPTAAVAVEAPVTPAATTIEPVGLLGSPAAFVSKVVRKANAPYGYRKDGAPRKAPRRKRAKK